MRTIRIAGYDMPIRATMRFELAVKEYLQRIADKAVADAEKGSRTLLEEAANDERANAIREASASAEMSLFVICELVNAAVEQEKVLGGHDRSGELPVYPLTVEKLAVIATLEELNSAENAAAVADEIAEARGSETKKLMAGKLMDLSRQMMTEA